MGTHLSKDLIQLMKLSQVQALFSAEIARVFEPEINKNRSFSSLLEHIRKPGNVGVFGMLRHPTFLVRDHLNRLIGLVKGEFKLQRWPRAYHPSK